MWFPKSDWYAVIVWYPFLYPKCLHHNYLIVLQVYTSITHIWLVVQLTCLLLPLFPPPVAVSDVISVGNGYHSPYNRGPSPYSMESASPAHTQTTPYHAQQQAQQMLQVKNYYRNWDVVCRCTDCLGNSLFSVPIHVHVYVFYSYPEWNLLTYMYISLWKLLHCPLKRWYGTLALSLVLW